MVTGTCIAIFEKNLAKKRQKGEMSMDRVTIKEIYAAPEKYSGKKVLAGPVEATALGNVISQMIYAKEIGSVEEAREIIRKMI